MRKTIGIFAHVDAGKTTFSEQLLYHTGSIRSLGRVDKKDAFLDDQPLERERGITIFSNQAVFSWMGDTYYLVDTPGHMDFVSEAERAVRVIDYAILLVSCVEGIEGQTETVWEIPVSYTHLDVYKRQAQAILKGQMDKIGIRNPIAQERQYNVDDIRPDIDFLRPGVEVLE